MGFHGKTDVLKAPTIREFHKGKPEEKFPPFKSFAEYESISQKRKEDIRQKHILEGLYIIAAEEEKEISLYHGERRTAERILFDTVQALNKPTPGPPTEDPFKTLLNELL